MEYNSLQSKVIDDDVPVDLEDEDEDLDLWQVRIEEKSESNYSVILRERLNTKDLPLFFQE